MMPAKPRATWEELHGRLQNAAAAVDQALAPDERKIAAVLRARAERLAQRAAEPIRPPAANTAVIFIVGEEKYAIELAELLEVRRDAAISAVPGAPPQLAGVTAVRGEIRAVWDTGRLLGVTSRPQRPAVLLLRNIAGHPGLLADGVEDVRPVELSASRHAPEGAAHIRGITPESIIVIDPRKLLGEEHS